MFYLIIAVLIVSYYLFMAPDSIKNTLNMIGLVAILALLLVLSAMSVIRIMQSPPEIFVAFAMIFLAYFALKDLIKMPKK